MFKWELKQDEGEEKKIEMMESFDIASLNHCFLPNAMLVQY